MRRWDFEEGNGIVLGNCEIRQNSGSSTLALPFGQRLNALKSESQMLFNSLTLESRANDQIYHINIIDLYKKNNEISYRLSYLL